MPHAIQSSLGSVVAPAIFLLLSLRSGRIYRHLGSHYFQTFEKEWLCNMITVNTASIRLRERNLFTYCSRYSLPPYVIREWVLEYLYHIDMEPGYCILSDSPVDATGLSNIIEFSSALSNVHESHESQVDRLAAFIEAELMATITRRSHIDI